MNSLPFPWSPAEIKKILEARELRPLKQLGQNFLFDANLCHWIIDNLPAPQGDAVLEIGPGLGALTLIMLQKGWKVTSLEIDRGLCQYLSETLGSTENFKLIEGDALKLISQQTSFSWIIGNLPYNISTPLIVEILKLPVNSL